MKRKAFALLSALWIVLCGLCPAALGEAGSEGSSADSMIISAQSSPEVSASEADQDAFPRVIDRITDPKAYPDFSFSGEDDLLEIWFPPVRDQDASIFLYQGQVWMLDCGDERAETETVPLLRYLGITQIDRLINTHPHHDHLNGIYAIDAVFPIRELLICFPEDATVHITAAMEYSKGNQITIASFEDEAVFPMGDGAVSLTAWQKTDEAESVNDRSAQFMVSYGLCSYLSMADIENQGQKQLYESIDPALLKADILRYPHHGKKPMNESVFQAIDPALVIITQSPRIHEIKDTTRYLDYKHIPVTYTNRSGSVIHLVTDGIHWLCEDVTFDTKAWLIPAE